MLQNNRGERCNIAQIQVISWTGYLGGISDVGIPCWEALKGIKDSGGSNLTHLT